MVIAETMNTLKTISQTGIIVILCLISGCKKTDHDNSLTVATSDIEEFGVGIYIFNGNIDVIGKEEVTMHGFYWSESENPETDGKLIQLGPRNTTGSFNSTVYDVLPGKTYYVKAFAMTRSVQSYGNVKSFTTPENMVLPIFDIDHNIYYPVRIGDQTWMSENLKVMRYPDGSLIPHIEDQAIWYDFRMYTEAFCWYDNIGIYSTLYGGLYTWPTAMHIRSESDIKPGKVQGVCPDGWHLPSDDEWKQLEIFLGMDQTEADKKENWRGDYEGDMMKNGGVKNWVSPDSKAASGSSFGALPAGWRDGAGFFKGLGTGARFWSSSKTGDYAWMRELGYNSPQVFRGTKGLYLGISVRCIRDTP
jgi:uncharacterized protein (TIGR02145 family)